MILARLNRKYWLDLEVLADLDKIYRLAWLGNTGCVGQVILAGWSGSFSLLHHEMLLERPAEGNPGDNGYVELVRYWLGQCLFLRGESWLGWTGTVLYEEERILASMYRKYCPVLDRILIAAGNIVHGEMEYWSSWTRNMECVEEGILTNDVYGAEGTLPMLNRDIV